MNYIEVRFVTTPNEEYISDVLCTLLGEIGFESFTHDEFSTAGYIAQAQYNEETIKTLITDFPFEVNIEYTINLIEGKNWNEEWEKNFFQPIVIEDQCVIHSSFHKDVPKATYDIQIDPKMSFGTGHHETTSLMLTEVLHADLSTKVVLDMGCGTAVLAILASMRGANPITAIDIDEWAFDNSIENCRLNNTDNIDIKLGGAELLETEPTYDIILANINRNILLNDIQNYAKCLKNGGSLFMSGFYEEDIPFIREEAEKHGLSFEYFRKKNNWVAVKFNK